MLKLQYIGQLMWSIDSLEKALRLEWLKEKEKGEAEAEMVK